MRDNAKLDLIIEDSHNALAKYMLRNTNHYDGDLARLTNQIQTNLNNMNWFNQLT